MSNEPIANRQGLGSFLAWVGETPAPTFAEGSRSSHERRAGRHLWRGQSGPRLVCTLLIEACEIEACEDTPSPRSSGISNLRSRGDQNLSYQRTYRQNIPDKGLRDRRFCCRAVRPARRFISERDWRLIGFSSRVRVMGYRRFLGIASWYATFRTARNVGHPTKQLAIRIRASLQRCHNGRILDGPF